MHQETESFDLHRDRAQRQSTETEVPHAEHRQWCLDSGAIRSAGEIAWQVPLGEGPTDHPALRTLALGRLGEQRPSGFPPGLPLLTKTLLFVAQAFEVDQPEGARSNDRAPAGISPKARGGLSAADKNDGSLLWETTTELPIRGAPTTYVIAGRQ
jgi:hypothetical protein